ncbi:MAG: beta strand repeat-containing protein, partial [Planctomycetia bacterium]
SLATGTVTINGNLNVNQLETFAGNYQVQLLGANNLVSTGTIFSNTGGLTFGLNSGDVTNFAGGLTATASNVSLAGTLQTINTPMVVGNLSLAEDASLVSGSGLITAATITDSSGGKILNLQDGTSASTGTVSITGNVTVSQINTFARNYNVQLLGSAVNVYGNSASSFTNTGTNTFGDGGDTVDVVTFAGGINANSGTVSLGSKLVSTNAPVSLGTVILGKNSTIQTGNGTINLGSVSDGTSNYTLSLQNDSGVATSRGSVTVNGDVDIFGLVTGAKAYAIQLRGNTTVNSQTTFNNTAGVNFGSNASNVSTFTNGVTAGTTGNGSIGISGTLQTVGAPIILGNSGSLINLLQNAVIDSGNSSLASINLGPVATNSKSLVLASGSTNGATITVASVDSTLGGLTIRDAGDLVTFSGSVGSTGGRGLVTITNSQQGVRFAGPLFATNLNINNTAVGQTIKFDGNINLTGNLGSTLQGYNIELNGSNNQIGTNTSFLNTGYVSINNSTNSTTTFSGGFTSSFPSSLKLNGNIISPATVNISSLVNLVGATSLTFNGTSNSVSGAISGVGSLTSNGTGLVNLTGNSSTYAGTLTSSNGNLAINANFTNASAQVSGSGTVSGIGTIGNLNVSNGTVAPGNSPGTLNVVNTALLGVNGGTFGTLNVELNGAAPGQY